MKTSSSVLPYSARPLKYTPVTWINNSIKTGYPCVVKSRQPMRRLVTYIILTANEASVCTYDNTKRWGNGKRCCLLLVNHRNWPFPLLRLRNRLKVAKVETFRARREFKEPMSLKPSSHLSNRAWCSRYAAIRMIKTKFLLTTGRHQLSARDAALNSLDFSRKKVRNRWEEL